MDRKEQQLHHNQQKLTRQNSLQANSSVVPSSSCSGGGAGNQHSGSKLSGLSRRTSKIMQNSQHQSLMRSQSMQVEQQPSKTQQFSSGGLGLMQRDSHSGSGKRMSSSKRSSSNTHNNDPLLIDNASI